MLLQPNLTLLFGFSCPLYVGAVLQWAFFYFCFALELPPLPYKKKEKRKNGGHTHTYISISSTAKRGRTSTNRLAEEDQKVDMMFFTAVDASRLSATRSTLSLALEA